MDTGKCNRAFDVALRILSGLSLLGTVVIVLLLHFVKREGPEFNPHEVLVLFILIAQFALFVLFAITGAILAGFRGGVRLSRLTAGLIVAAICAFIAAFFVTQ